ncbi:hypothetical protein N9Y89_02185 [bacterium]|nr:hypothetical protein [bacterium]
MKTLDVGATSVGSYFFEHFFIQLSNNGISTFIFLVTRDITVSIFYWNRTAKTWLEEREMKAMDGPSIRKLGNYLKVTSFGENNPFYFVSTSRRKKMQTDIDIQMTPFA